MNLSYICTLDGRMAEWLGRALQKLLQRFESASDLIITCPGGGIGRRAGLKHL